MAYGMGKLKTRNVGEWKSAFSTEENVAWRKENGREIVWNQSYLLQSFLSEMPNKDLASLIF